MSNDLVHSPSLAVPEESIKVEDVATSLLEGNYQSPVLHEAESPPTLSPLIDYVYTFAYPKEYTLTESIAQSDFHSRKSD